MASSLQTRFTAKLSLLSVYEVNKQLLHDTHKNLPATHIEWVFIVLVNKTLGFVLESSEGKVSPPCVTDLTVLVELST